MYKQRFVFVKRKNDIEGSGVYMSLHKDLLIDVISHESNSINGHIYGQVRNIGDEIAENITMQICYSNGFESSIYKMPKLEIDESASFEINYSAVYGTEKLDYEIIVSYNSKDEKYSYVFNDNLIIKEKNFEEFPTGLYLTDRPISDFALLEDGTAYSENFYGREVEKEKINAIFNGNSLIPCNIILQGIKRSGMTSVLTYLLMCVNLKCDDALAIYIDCSGINGKDAPIQRTLIDSVIRECRMLNVGNVSDAEWDAFAQKWTSDKDMMQRNLGFLGEFYQELMSFNKNKKLVLILDEFTTLLSLVEKSELINGSNQLRVLRDVIMELCYHDAVSLVISFAMTVKYLSDTNLRKLFPPFEECVFKISTLQISTLQKKDMEDMLKETYKEFPKVKFTNQSLDWIWKFTNGFAWYSKLVANCALNRAYSQERSIVYPSDIVDAVTTITGNDDYFRSLKYSCCPNGNKILDAIQSLTAKATDYVTISELLKLLSNDFTQRDIETILSALEMMQILQRNPFDRCCYRFAIELYWHYFRVSPSKYERCAETPVYFKECKVQKNSLIDDFFDI